MMVLGTWKMMKDFGQLANVQNMELVNFRVLPSFTIFYIVGLFRGESFTNVRCF